MLQYSQFYRTHGIRMVAQLTKPPMHDIAKLAIPMGSVFHFVDTDAEAVGITPEEPVIANNLSSIMVDHVINLSMRANHGHPVSVQFQPTSILADYHRKYKALKRARNQEISLRNQRMLLVLNYNLIHWHYRYQDNPMRPFYKWQNLYETLWDNLVDYPGCEQRQHFIQMHIPPTIPPISVLNQVGDHTNRVALQHIGTDAGLSLADVWQWIGPQREFSTLSKLTADQIKRINLIWIIGGKWTVLNLGVLDGWRKTPENAALHTTQFDSIMLQKFFLRLHISMLETVTVGVTEDELTEAAANPEPAPSTVVVDPDATEPELIDQTEDINTDEVSRDIDKLEEIDKLTYADDETGYRPYKPAADDLEQSLSDIATDYARRQIISAAELRRATTLAQRYKTIPDPFGGKGMLSDLTKISQEELKVDERSPILDDIPGVVDKSMLSCSLKHFDERYIRDVLPKDIVSMVMNLQKAGVAIQDYQIREFDDYNDSFDIHTIKVAPIVGKPTTLTFKIPRVNEDGTFKAAGTRYRMRKQRGD